MSKWKLVPVEATDQMIDAALDAKIGVKVLSCAEIYCAMLDAAPVPAADDCESVCDAYAAENQQFSDELARLRAENERLRGDNVHLRGHFEKAWPDTQRYRWLRATNMEQQNILAHYAYTEMDAAIDAAMAQGDKA